MRPLLGSHPADPQQVVLLAFLQRPVAEVDRVRDRAQRRQARRGGGELRPADADERGLVAVVGVERRRAVRERSVQRVHERGLDPVGQRERGEPQ